jgi:hypothetical protein
LKQKLTKLSTNEDKLIPSPSTQDKKKKISLFRTKNQNFLVKKIAEKMDPNKLLRHLQKKIWKTASENKNTFQT